jgi:ribonuclease P protein component
MKLVAPTSAQWRSLPRRGEASASVGSLLVVWHSQPEGRVGMVVSRQRGNAVMRNRIRRRLRVAAQQLAGTPGCWLLIARSGIEDLSSAELTQLVERARRRIERSR